MVKSRLIIFFIHLVLAICCTKVFAHGSMEIPISRIYTCYKEGPENVQSEACKAFVAVSGKQPLYDWDMINQFNANDQHQQIIPDGMLCAGGRDKYKGLDLARSDWPTTTIQADSAGKYNFIFKATVPHLVKYFQIFVTKDSYSFSRPMNWSDLEELCKIPNVPLTNGTYQMYCPLNNKTGRRIIYAIWQRSDSAEAFYSCSDVNIGGTSGGDTWKSIGDLTATSTLPVNTKVVFWLSKNCQPIANYTITVGAGQNQPEQWPFYLAQEVNSKSTLVNLGQLNSQNDTVVPIMSATLNKVYVKDADVSSYSYAIDLVHALNGKPQRVYGKPYGACKP